MHRSISYTLSLWTLCLCTALAQPVSTMLPTGFKKTVITREFISEGSAVADVNGDGLMDIIAGYHWFEAPGWKVHPIPLTEALGAEVPAKGFGMFAKVFNPRKEYSNSFLNLGMDVNLDGWDDVVIIDYPGLAAFWLENPKNEPGKAWKKHIIADSMGVSNESPAFVDIDQDGRLDILCGDYTKRQIVWLKAPTKKGETRWQRFALSAEKMPGTDRFSHGIGWGDINKDGLNDVVVREGWYEGTDDLKSGNWVFHPANLGEPCSHMKILDVDGDGKNDVVSASAHALGVWWHQQVVGDKGQIEFKTNLLSTTTAQTHAAIMADLNGNGKKEYLTGKRFLAHNGNDKGDDEAPLLFWIEFTPGQPPYWKEHILDTDSGAGLNITVRDMNNDTTLDIVVANKNGVFLFENFLKR